MIKNKKKMYKYLLFSYIILIIVLSSLPLKNVTIVEFPIKDKIEHFIEYFIFGFLLYKNVLNFDRIKNKKMFVAVFAIIFAITDEIHQGFVGYFDTGIFGGIRDCSAFDWMADSIGILVVLYVFSTIERKKLKNSSS